MRIFHLVAPDEWAKAVTAGAYQPPSLTTEGFVHCSFAEQLLSSADRHFASAADLVAVELDADRLSAPVRVEDSYGAGTAYPHVYGPLETGAAVAVRPLHRDADGGWAHADG